MAEKRNAGVRRLSDAEEMIMTIIWRAQEDLALMDIRKRVNSEYDKQWKPQTVSTFLHRLREKGFLRSYRAGRQTYYQPVILLQDYREDVFRTIVDRLYEGHFSM